MSPQVFEKAFSAANNIRAATGRRLLSEHFLAIVDPQADGGSDGSHGEPPSRDPAYYLRFCKSFYRLGGTLDYIRCDNRVFLVDLVRKLGLNGAPEKTLRVDPPEQVLGRSADEARSELAVDAGRAWRGHGS
jgi:hypothetical protein